MCYFVRPRDGGTFPDELLQECANRLRRTISFEREPNHFSVFDKNGHLTVAIENFKRKNGELSYMGDHVELHSDEIRMYIQHYINRTRGWVDMLKWVDAQIPIVVRQSLGAEGTADLLMKQNKSLEQEKPEEFRTPIDDGPSWWEKTAEVSA